mmetsp:Transcript_41088/g.83922  ORF Transcript_41088/g.83922 Transcript_41088/m.83922 type:complete len:203 (+) Transcript_41088:363-971(+)
MACLESMIWLCQVALRMVIFVLFWPAECNGTLKVRFAELVTTTFFHSLHSKWNGSLAIDIINSTEAKFLCWPSTGFDGSCTCKCDEIAPRDLESKLVLHLAKQTTSFVQIGIVSPFVLWPMTLSCSLTATSCCAIHHTQGARAMPCQPFKEASVAGNVTILRTISRPKCLGVFHQLGNGLVQMFDIQFLQLLVVLSLVELMW